MGKNPRGLLTADFNPIQLIVSSMIAGAIGLVAVFFDRVPSLVPMVTDGLGALFFLAGGIAWAVGMKGQTCSLSDADKLFENPLLNQGCYPIDGGTYCYVLGADGSPDAAWDKLQGVCRKAFANETFLFVGFASFLVLIALSFLQSKRKGPKSGFVA